ncbi:SDR family NAD(P)-dependent oxidoreductase [Pseudonocardia sp. GCM10023141]|uniref:SDR family NAD(P)-dependent oxidoreductase n=1 Tax=Pseudonocardia sp. GCM10023141 TaxID=3252653 RepID=UPI003619FD5A
MGALLARPVTAVSDALNRPSAESTPHAIVRSLRGHPSLRDALRDKIVLITGASSGIGEAAAVAIGAAGGTALLVARGAEKLYATAHDVEAAGGTAHVHPCDLTDMEAIDKLVADVIAQHGRVDILVNNAGRSIRRSLALSYDRFHDYERTMQLNYFAPVRLMLGLLPGMRERGNGHVINISSVGVLTRAPRFGAYIASKSALDTLTDAWQAETGPDDVRFTTVYMSLVRTPMIAPTKLYDKFPALAPEQAAGVICDAITDRPRRVSPAFGRFAFLADSITPEIMDSVRSRGFKLFGDSRSARGEQQLTPEGKAFIEATRGVHW